MATRKHREAPIIEASMQMEGERTKDVRSVSDAFCC